jgi:hypothetical protein
MSIHRKRGDCVYALMEGRGNFKRLYNDADRLVRMVQDTPEGGYFFKCCLPRISILLFAISLEALANQLIDDIVARAGSTTIDERCPTRDKWKMIPSEHPDSIGKGFNTMSKSWRQFTELVKWRDESVHPKALNPVVVKVVRSGEKEWEYDFVRLSEVPKKLRETLLKGTRRTVYGESGLPASPHEAVLEHAEAAKGIVDAMVKRMDELLGGCLSGRGFLKEGDIARAIHPDGTSQTLELLGGLDFPGEGM